MIFLSNLAWSILIPILILTALFLVFKLSLKGMFSKKIRLNKSLFMLIGSKVGVGNIVGMAIAYNIGGIGVLFWVFVSAVLAMILSFTEGAVATQFKQNGLSGLIVYSQEVIKTKKNKNIMMWSTSILLILAYGLLMSGIQSSTIGIAFEEHFDISLYITFLFLIIVVSLIVFKGRRLVVNALTMIVSLFGLLYFGLGIYIVFTQVTLINNMLLLVLIEAFTFDAGFMALAYIGLKRGFFSNEGGLGLSGHAATVTAEKDPNVQGVNQAISIVFDFIFCFITIMILHLSVQYSGDLNPVIFVVNAMDYHFGDFGQLSIIISFILFGLSTILANIAYGEMGLENLSLLKWKTLFRIISIVIFGLAIFIPQDLVWGIADLMTVLFASINIFAILILAKKINYFRSIKNV